MNGSHWQVKDLTILFCWQDLRTWWCCSVIQKILGKQNMLGETAIGWWILLFCFYIAFANLPRMNILLFPNPQKSGESCIEIAKNPGWTRAHLHVIKSQCFPHSYLSAKVRGTLFRLGRVACWWDASWGVPMPTMWSKRRDLAPLGVSLLYGGNEVLYYLESVGF